jgi:tetratricopeptide (TPR) repeat protein
MTILRYFLCVFLASAILTHRCSAQPFDDDLDALNEQVLRLLNAAKHNEAVPLARRALALAKRLHGPDHTWVGTCQNNLGRLYHAQGLFADAEPLYRNALVLYERNLGPGDPRVAIPLNNLALLLQATNRLSEAEALMRRALAAQPR